MSFQDEINEIRAKKLSDAQSSSASRTERNRQTCEPYIEWICERTREELKAAARDGKIRYQEKDTYRYDLYGNSELLTEEKNEPALLLVMGHPVRDRLYKRHVSV